MARPTHRLGAYGIVFNRNAEALLVPCPREPYRGLLALPGGLVRSPEAPKDAIARHLLAKTGLRATHIRLFDDYPTPAEDPRDAIVSLIYILAVSDIDCFYSKSKRPELWHRDWSCLPLAFNHKFILEDVVWRLPQLGQTGGSAVPL